MRASWMALTVPCPAPPTSPTMFYNYLVDEFAKLCSSQEFIDAMEAANLTPACNSAEEYQEFIDGKVELITSLQDYLMAGED